MNNAKKLFRPSQYFKPASVGEAVELFSQYDGRGRFIAGGTDTLVDKNPEVEVFIDITGLGLDYIESDGDGVRIGATTTFAEIEASPLLAKAPYGVLAEAAGQMGTPQIRNMATIGGNLCSAVPSADSAVSLLALDAILSVVGPYGKREIGIADFFLDARKTALKGELLTEVRLPVLPEQIRTVFLKEGRIATGDLAVVNVAVCLDIAADNTCQDVRIALGAVAPTPLRARESEAILRGAKLQKDLIRKAANHAAEEIRPISDVRGSADYRRTLSRVLVEQALKEAITLAGKGDMKW